MKRLPALALLLLAACRQQPAIQPGSGQAIFLARCAVCHGVDGQGRPGMYPALPGSTYVSGPREPFAAIILDGLQGPVGNFNAVMPGWRAYLSDAEIAEVMSWLRAQSGQPPVTPVQVAQVRAETEGRNTFWTAQDLQSVKLHN